MALISIVMPTYNQGKFILESVNSILAQTFPDWELIIVNDGSTDNTMEILHAMPTDPRIIIVDKENGGTGSALNMGFRYASAPFETWFASDNRLYPCALMSLYTALLSNRNIDYVYSSCDIGTMDSTGLQELDRFSIQREVDQVWDDQKLFHHYFLGICWLWRKELREKCGPFQLEPCEDYDMVLRMVEAGGRFFHLNLNLAWFRRHNENMSMQIRKENGPEFYSYFVQDKAKKRRGLL